VLSDPATANLRAPGRRLTGAYGKAKYCPKLADGTTGPCMALGEMEKVLADSRDPAR
jgi:peptidyl-dipeptidase A